MDTQTLAADIATAVKVLEGIEGLFPNGARLETYTNFLASVLENPTVLALLNAWINTLAGQPTPAPTPPSNS